jgi:four helix bundle protein
MPTIFDHEKLNVYQRSLDFVEFAETLLSDLAKGLAAHDQIDRASTSMPLNLAEGNGNFAAKDRCRFFDIARGSALECAAALDVLTRRNKIGATTAEEGKIILKEVVSMIVGLIRSQEGGRVYEDSAAYNEGG